MVYRTNTRHDIKRWNIVICSRDGLKPGHFLGFSSTILATKRRCDQPSAAASMPLILAIAF